MKNIIVPTDFSDCAKSAASAAADIARHTGSKLYLMHIINLPTYASNTGVETWHDIAEGLFITKYVKKKFDELKAEAIFEGLDVEEIVKYNSVYESIATVADEKKADLIVMGSQGISGSKEMFIGSNTERVIRSSVVPVLTIKKRRTPFLIKDIIFASNFFEESYPVFSEIKKIAEVFDANIHLLKVVTPSSFETTRYSIKLMEDFAEKTNLETNFTINVYNDNKIENGIHHFADEMNADLIAMETHGRTGIKHMIFGSITEGVANHATIPVLSVKIPKEIENENVLFPD